MTLEEKYNKWKEIFYKYFIFKSNNNEQGSNIPLQSINFDTFTGISGDGTINLSEYLQYVYTKWVLYEDEDEDERENVYNTLCRLIDSCYTYFSDKHPEVYFKRENGFFFRDDIPAELAPEFSLNYINSGYSGSIQGNNEDPCYSVFTSQDQVWNLIPILSWLPNSSFKEIGYNITEYIVRNKHRIYNPYYSALYHHWTYLPDLNSNFYSRIQDRNEHLKYKIRVKRGSYNWYFAYGFKKAFNEFGGNSNTFWSSLWYKPFIFLADRIWEPIIKLFGGSVKNTSYYSLAIGAGAWYFGDPEKRLIKRFNKSLKEGELFMPQLVFLTHRHTDIDLEALLNWLNNYPEPSLIGNVKSPLIFMILYNWHKITRNECVYNDL